jgi:hypothetical protein
MKAPVSLRTFPVKSVPMRPRRIEQFVAACQGRWSFVLTADEARKRLAARKSVLNTEVKNAPAGEEPMSARISRKSKNLKQPQDVDFSS